MQVISSVDKNGIAVMGFSLGRIQTMLAVKRVQAIGSP
jgi:hypothetical protein